MLESRICSTGTSTQQMYGRFFRCLRSLAQDPNSATTRIFDGGIITGAGSLTSGVGQVLDSGRAGLNYQILTHHH